MAPPSKTLLISETRAGVLRLGMVMPFVVTMVVLAAVPLVVSDSYFLHLAILLFMWVALGQSWNLLGGYAGQISFGHSAFFGLGAYACGLLFTKAGIPVGFGVLAGGLVSVVAALPIGWICFRLRGPYFSLTILGFSEILRLIVTNWRDLTNGAVGVLFPPVFPSKVPFYFTMLGLAALTTAVCYIVVTSKLGYYFRAIREDEDSAEAMGINAASYKLVALEISAVLTGLVGAVYAAYVAYIDPPGVFSVPDVAIAMVVVAIIGGLGTFVGPLIGAVVVVVLSEVMRTTLGHVHLLVYAAMIMLVVLFMPEGILGFSRRLGRRWRSRVPSIAQQTPGTRGS